MTLQTDSADRGFPREALLGRLPRLSRPDGSPIRVLLVDDEVALTDLVSRALRYEGWIIDVAHDGRSAFVRYQENPPDLIVLDIMLPDIDGLQILDRLRQSRRCTPVLFLTARDSVKDRVTGLIAGGDDYMTKPFSLAELVARLRGLLRRSGDDTSSGCEILTVGDLVLNCASHEVTRADTPIVLTITEFELLRYLMGRPGRALTRAEILGNVWQYDFSGRSNVVDLYVSYLRKKIDAGREPMIHTVRGIGYMLRAVT